MRTHGRPKTLRIEKGKRGERKEGEHKAEGQEDGESIVCRQL